MYIYKLVNDFCIGLSVFLLCYSMGDKTQPHLWIVNPSSPSDRQQCYLKRKQEATKRSKRKVTRTVTASESLLLAKDTALADARRRPFEEHLLSHLIIIIINFFRGLWCIHTMPPNYTVWKVHLLQI